MLFFRFLSIASLITSLLLVLALVGWDAAHAFRPLAVHPSGVAVALMVVGLSYAVAHLPGKMRLGARIRAISLGGAFVLWGAEQFMPPGRGLVVADCVLVIVFVVDLSLGAMKRLTDASREEL